MNQTEYLELGRWTFSIVIPALSGLVGVTIGAWLTSRRERTHRRHDFISQQLSNFYSPLLGLRTEIRMRSEFRVRVHETANAAWVELCEAARRVNTETLERLSRERFPEFDKILEFDNARFINELLPAYRRMVTVFRDNLWLAESETRDHFPNLLEFVEIWDRSVADSLPREVLTRLGHNEKALQPLYNNLQETHDALRSQLAAGDA